MISATCCRCGRELDQKGGVLLTPPAALPVRSLPTRLDGDIVGKHHVCVSCMEALMDWLKQQPADRRKTFRCDCGAELVACSWCGVAGEPVGHIVCPVAEREAGLRPVVKYHRCSLHFSVWPAPAPAPTVSARSRLHAACCQEVDGGLCARAAEHPGDCDPHVAHEDGRTWTLQMVPPSGTETVDSLRSKLDGIKSMHQKSVTANMRLAEQVLNAETRQNNTSALLKEMRPFLKFAKNHWPETSNPQSFVKQIDDLEARIDNILALPDVASFLAGASPAPPTHTGLTTTHVLFEGRPLCGFMAGCTPSGWPDGHNWVSIVEVVEREPGVLSIPTSETCKPCDRCVSLASATALVRSRA